MIEGKNVVLGVTGGIAAYKTVEVASRLVKSGAAVDVIMTENAARFVSPLTFRTITGKPVTVGMFDEPKIYEVQHISLAHKADLIAVIPATANIIGKVANGIADDMLTTTIMAADCKVLFAPAMNSSMFSNSIVQENIQKLSDLGYLFVEPDTGLLACGETGKGRLAEPAKIVEGIEIILASTDEMKGFKVLVTAGPTREPLDPVRYITNRSSGKMGYAIAAEARRRGAEVLLVSGPVNLGIPAGVGRIDVTTANEMYSCVMEKYADYDIIILMAAVADYKSSDLKTSKIKKDGDNLSLELTKNKDIAYELGQIKGEKLLIGACAETENLDENALRKLEKKNFDLIAANDVTVKGAGFEVDTNVVKLFRKDGTSRQLPLMMKTAVAAEIIDEIVKLAKDKKYIN
ncbi:MAG: bifunctional phosphopantothenoylcysteine decarboxylase/phosphopantothenate--cysteine ligase CoaBC [Eubacteriales bacterium]|nr:bifunctional phosphopantothenoylcysteine decarboxylase/phosphopantothenate--cysteine ligase CoaBC [Eubacteriales bacterium]